MAAGKKTGGRQKGTPNKTNAAREAEIKSSGLTPLDYMLSVLRNTDATPEQRQWAANAAARYCHPAMSSIEANVAVTGHEAALDDLE